MSIHTDITLIKSKIGDLLEGWELYELPTPTLNQWIDWIDSERIPEFLSRVDRGVELRYSTQDVIDRRVAWYRGLLSKVQRLYEQGHIDAETYTRLTEDRGHEMYLDNPPYPDESDRIRKLRLASHSWRPYPGHCDIDGNRYYYITPTPDTFFVVRCIDDQWYRQVKQQA